MGKKTFSAVTTLVFLFLLLADTSLVAVVRANPVRLAWIPTTPDVSVPQVTIESPLQCASYNSSEVIITFTVLLPESWFSNDPTSEAPAGYYCNGKILSAQIIIDDRPAQNVTLSNDNYLPYSSDLPLSRNVTSTARFEVSEGNHVLFVHVVGESYYMPPENWDPKTHEEGIIVERYPVNSNSTPLTFYVNPSPVLSPPPATPSTFVSPSDYSMSSPQIPELPVITIPLLLVLFLAVAAFVWHRRPRHGMF